MKNRLTLALSVCALTASAQTERAAFTQTGHGYSMTSATDYQCVGINPANLGWERKYKEKKVTFGIGEIGYTLHTTALDKADLKEQFIKPLLGGDEPDFTYQEKVDASKLFTDAPFAFSGDAMLFGIAWQHDSIGGFAFVARDRMQWYSKFNSEVSQLMFQGFWAPYFTDLGLGYHDGNGDPVVVDTVPNNAMTTQSQRDSTVRGGNPNGRHVLSDIMDGSAYDFLWYREYGLSYGRKLMQNPGMQLFGGIGVKYLRGFGMIDISSEDGEFEARSSLSPGFKIDYGENASKNPSYVAGEDLKAVGSGFAIDLGVSAVINEKIKVGLSYVDLGSITWDGNVWVAADSVLNTLDENGFDNYNFFDQADNFASDQGIYEWTGKADVKTKLPSTFRAGVGYVAGEKLEMGAELVLPTNKEPGAYRSSVISLGLDYRPVEVLALSVGMSTGGFYPVRVPMGLTFTTKNGGWEAGVATRDIKGLFGTTEPVLSACFGVLRFRL